jgi:hypothetical protein
MSDSAPTSTPGSWYQRLSNCTRTNQWICKALGGFAVGLVIIAVIVTFVTRSVETSTALAWAVVLSVIAVVIGLAAFTLALVAVLKR